MGRNVTVIPAKKKNQQGKKSQKAKIRVAAYCRVSTEQEEQLNSFGNQVDYYTEYINQKPKYELVDIYADEGITRTKTKKREGFNRRTCMETKIVLILNIWETQLLRFLHP